VRIRAELATQDVRGTEKIFHKAEKGLLSSMLKQALFYLNGNFVFSRVL